MSEIITQTSEGRKGKAVVKIRGDELVFEFQDGENKYRIYSEPLETRFYKNGVEFDVVYT